MRLYRAARVTARQAVVPVGFVLLAVLWIMIAIGALALTVQLASRDAVQSAARRAELRIGHWLAEDCLARARLVIDSAIAAERHVTGPSEHGWRSVPVALERSHLLTTCDLTSVPSGTVIDVNAATEGQLRRLLHANTRFTAGRIDSIVDAILDWRDGDDLPRAHGAERAWYVEAGRHPPRNGRFADVRELRRVRGMDGVTDADALLGTEVGRLSLALASPRVLISLPGMTDEALLRLEELRGLGNAAPDLAALAGLVSPSARDSLQANFAALSRLVTTEPEAWILSVRERTSGNAVATIEVRLVRSGTRAVVTRRREWP